MLEIIKPRRSIRHFLRKPVPPEVLSSLLEAIQWAPSGGNRQPWLVVVVQKPTNIEKIKMFAPGLSGDPTALLVLCSDRSAKGSTFIMDISMAAQNVLLVATENGLGSCVIRSFNQAAIQSLLQLPSHVMPELLISLGYPAGSVEPPKRRAIEEFVHWERYGGHPDE